MRKLIFIFIIVLLALSCKQLTEPRDCTKNCLPITTYIQEPNEPSNIRASRIYPVPL